MVFAVHFIAVVLSMISIHSSASAATESEEQRLLRISKTLRPISDAQWNEITLGRGPETYDVQSRDTLWDISKRLFGNSFYWPKIWSLNNNIGIENPHIINPGQKLAFLPGSSDSAPSLRPDGETSATQSDEEPVHVAPTTTRSGKMHEYDKIPPELWAPENPQKYKKTEYDEYGLDKQLRVMLPEKFTFRVPAIANDATIPYLGEIVGSRREGVGLSETETVFLRSSSQDLQVGTSYSVFDEPEVVREKKSDRTAYIYTSVGEVRIIGVKDELYIGVITKSYDVVKRGQRVYPLLPLISSVNPVAARSSVEALAVYGTLQRTRNTSQFQFIHFDRGIEDGVQVGNVFRVYDYYDPQTKKKLTDSDFLTNADAVVVHTTAQFSTALVLRARETLARGDFGVLLADISDLTNQRRARDRFVGDAPETTERGQEDRELDELDALDRTSGEGLGRKEEQEIKELDKWDRTKDMQNQTAPEPVSPSDASEPTDDVEKAPTLEPDLAPSTPIEPAPPTPESPTLDQTLDSNSATPSTDNSNTTIEDQTLDATPPPPPVEEQTLPALDGGPQPEGTTDNP